MHAPNSIYHTEIYSKHLLLLNHQITSSTHKPHSKPTSHTLKMPFFKRSLAGPGYVVLNIIRVCNIIALIAIVAASFGMLVKTFQVSKFFFFDAISHLITGCLARKFPFSPPYKLELTMLYSGPHHHRNRHVPPIHSPQLAPLLPHLRLHHPRRRNDHSRCLRPRQPQQNSYIRGVPRNNNLAARHRQRDCRLNHGLFQHLRELHVPREIHGCHCTTSPGSWLYGSTENRRISQPKHVYTDSEDAKTVIPLESPLSL